MVNLLCTLLCSVVVIVVFWHHLNRNLAVLGEVHGCNGCIDGTIECGAYN